MVVLGFEFKAALLLGNYSFPLSHASSPFGLVFSDRVSNFCHRPGLDLSPPISASCVDGIIGMSQQVQLVFLFLSFLN
jgi:hypothetical protein